MATGGRSGGTLHTSWLWLLTMVEAIASIPGMHVVWGFGKSRVLTAPPCAFSSPHLHLCPLLHGLLAFYLVLLCHLYRLNPFLDSKKDILLSTLHIHTQMRQVSLDEYRIVRVFECGNPPGSHCTPKHPVHSLSHKASRLGTRD